MYLQITTRCNMTCAHCAHACTTKGEDMKLNWAEKAMDEADDNGDGITIGGGEPTMHPKFWEILAYAVKTLDYAEFQRPFIITNGKRTEDALALAWLADHGIVSAHISRDDFHDSISQKVIDAFNPKHRCGWQEFKHVPKSMAHALGYDEICEIIDMQQLEDEDAEEENREPREITAEDALENFWETLNDRLESRNSELGIEKGYWTVKKIRARGRGKNISGAEDDCVGCGIHVSPDGVWQCACKRLKLADDVWCDFYDLTPNHTECSESEYFQEALELQTV